MGNVGGWTWEKKRCAYCQKHDEVNWECTEAAVRERDEARALARIFYEYQGGHDADVAAFQVPADSLYPWLKDTE